MKGYSVSNVAEDRISYINRDEYKNAEENEARDVTNDGQGM